jgi:hypothetical protein
MLARRPRPPRWHGIARHALLLLTGTPASNENLNKQPPGAMMKDLGSESLISDKILARRRKAFAAIVATVSYPRNAPTAKPEM